MKKAIFAVLLLLATTGRAGAQVDSSCLVMWQDSPLFIGSGYAWINPDSVKVDICSGPQYLDEFGTGPFLVIFNYYIVPDSLAIGGDTLIRSWRDVDSSFPGIRAGLDSIEQRFGHFIMVLGGSGHFSDTSGATQWYMNFDNYLDIDTADFYLRMLPGIHKVFAGADTLVQIEFSGYPRFFEAVSKDVPPKPVNIWPQPCKSELHIGALFDSNLTVYDALGRTLDITTRPNGDGTIVADVSKIPSGLYYFSLSGQFYKVLIQR